jgi:hypothetical protein
MHKCFVEVRVIKPGMQASSFTGSGQTWFTPDGEDFVFASRLEPTASVSEHLKWLHGMLQFERKRLRQLQEDGVDMFCSIRVRARTLSIEPEALLLMHQCHLRTEISFNP